MEQNRPCPVCGNWRWRPGEVPDEDGHHPDCGVNLRRRQQAQGEFRCWEKQCRVRRDDARE